MPRKYTEEERASAFWEKVDRSGGPDACWPWLGQRDGKTPPYGRASLDGRSVKAHRLAWFYSTGSWPPPETPLVLHAPVVCHNRLCVNPAHLRLGTPADNVRDMALDGSCKSGFWQRAVTHCPKGHEYTPENTYHNATPGHAGRMCRACNLLRYHARRAAGQKKRP